MVYLAGVGPSGGRDVSLIQGIEPQIPRSNVGLILDTEQWTIS